MEENTYNDNNYDDFLSVQSIIDRIDAYNDLQDYDIYNNNTITEY